MMKIKPVAVILLNWNTPHHTIACIHSFIKYNSRETFDMIVVDNGSTDGSLERIKHHFPDLIYIDNKTNLGFAEGNNNALKYSLDNGYSYSLILNNDTQVEEDIISPMLVHLNNNTDVGAVQPVIYSLANRHRLWNGGAYFNPLFGITYSKKKPVNEVKKVDWVTGCCFLVRNEALKKAGLFNPLYFLY